MCKYVLPRQFKHWAMYSSVFANTLNVGFADVRFLGGKGDCIANCVLCIFT